MAIIYPFSDIIIANSKGIKSGFNKFLINKVKIIYPPSISKILKPNKKLKIPKKFKAVCFSRLSNEKNLECAINSFKYLKKDNITLTIYGNGYLKKKLIYQTKRLDLDKKISFRKHTYDVGNEIKKFDLLISPSFFEGCSNSIIEALNNDLLVIASKCPGGNKEILSYGKSGELFSTNNDYDLSLKIKNTINNFADKKYEYRKSRFFLKNFLLKKNVREFSKIFNNI